MQIQLIHQVPASSSKHGTLEQIVHFVSLVGNGRGVLSPGVEGLIPSQHPFGACLGSYTCLRGIDPESQCHQGPSAFESFVKDVSSSCSCATAFAICLVSQNGNPTLMHICLCMSSKERKTVSMDEIPFPLSGTAVTIQSRREFLMPLPLPRSRPKLINSLRARRTWLNKHVCLACKSHSENLVGFR